MKAIKSARAAEFEIGGVEVAPDGTIRVLGKDATERGSDLDKWLDAKGGKDAPAP